jgi:glycosyltransferase involved in cell wall biosynthesis
MRIALITARDPITPALDQLLQPQSLARALARSGHRVTLYARNQDAGCPSTAIIGGVPVEYVNAGPAGPLDSDEAAKHMPEFAAALAHRWRSKPPDVVHAFSWTSGLAALAAVRGTDVPVVQTFVSLGCAERRHEGSQPVSATRLRLEPAIARTVNAVLAGSADEAAELARMGVPKAAVRVVPAGVDTESFSPDGKAAARGRKARLVAVAAPGQERGLAAVIGALAQVREAELVIAGDVRPEDGIRNARRHRPRTSELPDLAGLIASAGVRGRITSAGPLTQTKLAALLRSADVLVSASAYEPSGLAAIQAMACGTPAIVSAVGGQRDAVIHGTTGLLVPPLRADALVHRLRMLLAAPAMRQAYGIAAADRARSRYAWQRIAAETVAVYERCLPAHLAVQAAEDEADRADDLVAAFA